MISHILWLTIFVLLVLLGVVFTTILKYSSKTDHIESEEDLEEWDCPTCGFHIQMGTECIYCGEKKAIGKDQWEKK